MSDNEKMLKILDYIDSKLQSYSNIEAWEVLEEVRDFIVDIFKEDME